MAVDLTPSAEASGPMLRLSPFLETEGGERQHKRAPRGGSVDRTPGAGESEGKRSVNSPLPTQLLPCDSICVTVIVRYGATGPHNPTSKL